MNLIGIIGAAFVALAFVAVWAIIRYRYYYRYLQLVKMKKTLEGRNAVPPRRKEDPNGSARRMGRAEYFDT
jgi:hypothetical protein